MATTGSARPHSFPPPAPVPAPRRRPAAERRADKAEREAARWAAKYANAATPAQRAAVDFDRVRSAIRKLEDTDPTRATAYWSELSALLGRLRNATQRDVAPKRR